MNNKEIKIIPNKIMKELIKIKKRTDLNDFDIKIGESFNINYKTKVIYYNPKEIGLNDIMNILYWD